MKSRFAVVCSARFSTASRYGHRFAAAGNATCGRRSRYSRPRVALLAAANRLFVKHFGKIKFSGSALAAEHCAGPHNRLLRRQHCSSLCSQSEGHEHVANMASASGHDFVGFSARAWPPQYSSPSLCEQSELQCFASDLRCMFAQRRPLKGRVFKIQIKSSLAAAPSQRRFALAHTIVCCGASIVAHFARKVRATNM